MNKSMTRRGFLRAVPVAFGAIAAWPTSLIARPRGEAHGCSHTECSSSHCKHAHRHAVGMKMNHPEPREGITSEEVFTRAELEEQGIPEEVIELYEGIAQIPEIADGLACYCGCMLPPMNRRSLLTCFHRDGMARGCNICQGTARLVIRRHAEGQSIDRIRAAVDARFG